MIIACCILFLSQFILIPIVFSVHRTNNKVLSLFGFIPTPEITELAQKCERYIVSWLEERNEKRDWSFEKSQADMQASVQNKSMDASSGQIYTEVNVDDPSPGENLQNSMMMEGSGVDNKMQNYQANGKPDPKALFKSGAPMGNSLAVPAPQFAKGGKHGTIHSPSMSRASVDTPTRPLLDQTMSGKKVEPKEMTEKEKEKNAEQELDVLNERAQKLLNAKDNNRRNVIFQFVIVTSIFICYFVAVYIVQITFLKQVRACFDHLQLISSRAPNVKYAHAFAMEEAALAYPYLINNQDMAVYYLNQVYATENAVTTSLQQKFPSQFSNYMTSLVNYNLGDVCSWYYNASLGLQWSQAICETVDSGIISKGLQTSIVHIVEQDRQVISNFFNGTPITPSLQYGAINDYRMFQSNQILNNIIPAIENLEVLYLQNFSDYLTYGLSMNKVDFSVTLIFIFFIYLFVWSPYLRNLSSKIWRTKGMLNMIPMEIISKYDSLKQAFIGGDLLQAVK
jgi:uncharacterized membrane protein